MLTKKVKNSASDIETPEEFDQIVKKSVIWDTGVVKEIHIWLDLDPVKVLWSKHNVAEDSDNDNESIYNEDGHKNTEIPYKLAHARKLLSDKWGNHHNQHLTYIDPHSSITWELTDPQIDTWVCHIANTKATVNDPPAVQNLMRMSELEHTANIFQSITNILTNGAQKSLVDTTAQGSETITSNSPINSPSKLLCFLTYAKNKGVYHALQYQTVLRGVDFGPDILLLIGTDSLTDLGVSDGDAIRLKSLAVDWWKSPEMERLCLPNIIALKGTREIDDDVELNDFTWFYHCKIQNMMVELPSHLEPILDGEDEPDDNAGW
ncbi:hypothetical protein F5146DRAFT_1139171 [Armillaria mellea]|nr:hypothetical protein F5146DRAFT_1139171 [Armillaria mellea]